MSKPSKSDDEMTNSPLWLLLAVPAMLVGCIVVIVLGAIGVLGWSASTVEAWLMPKKEQ